MWVEWKSKWICYLLSFPPVEVQSKWCRFAGLVQEGRKVGSFTFVYSAVNQQGKNANWKSSTKIFQSVLDTIQAFWNAYAELVKNYLIFLHWTSLASLGYYWWRWRSYSRRINWPHTLLRISHFECEWILTKICLGLKDDEIWNSGFPVRASLLHQLDFAALNPYRYPGPASSARLQIGLLAIFSSQQEWQWVAFVGIK